MGEIPIIQSDALAPIHQPSRNRNLCTLTLTDLRGYLRLSGKWLKQCGESSWRLGFELSYDEMRCACWGNCRYRA